MWLKKHVKGSGTYIYWWYVLECYIQIQYLYSRSPVLLLKSEVHFGVITLQNIVQKYISDEIMAFPSLNKKNLTF